ncbi:MAG: hypothetical protein KAS32_27905 [Candidatus Peribacteraceae bacterium]|nr:hypothetical protein [Candidatus Peribacteraceae bacterium]
MKIEKSIPREIIPKTQKDGMLFEAIERYTKRRRYPKSLVAKKVDLAHKRAMHDVRKLQELNNQADKEVTKTRSIVIQLNQKCAQLIQKLQRSI